MPPAGAGAVHLPGQLPDDEFAVSGSFDFQPQYAAASAAGDQLELSFIARDVYLVMAADSPVQATVTVTGARTSATEDVSAGGAMVIGQARLYHLVHLRFRCAGRGDHHLQRPGRARLCLHVRRLTRPTRADRRSAARFGGRVFGGLVGRPGRRPRFRSRRRVATV